MTAGQFVLAVFDECDDRFVAADIPFDLFQFFIFATNAGSLGCLKVFCALFESGNFPCRSSRRNFTAFTDAGITDSGNHETVMELFASDFD